MSRDYRTLEYLRHLLRKTPELAFSPGRDMASWKQDIKRKVYELMALEGNVYEEPQVNLLCSKQRDGYRVDKYEISSEEALWTTMLVLVPDGASPENTTPGVLCMPGCTWTKEQLAGEEFTDLDYEPAQFPDKHRYYFANCQALRYVRRGFTAIACDDFFTGETGQEESPFRCWDDASQVLIGMGRSILGITVGMRLAQLSFLKSLPFVDAARIGVTAHSLGTEAAMLACILDEDVRAFVFNDFLSDSKERLLACTPPEPAASYIMSYKEYPGEFRWFTYPDLLAAYAPRKLLITEGGMTSQLEKVASAYEKAGAREAFEYQYYREFADPASRKYDNVPLPMGITMAEYFERANVKPDKHYFKYETAVPWLEDALKNVQDH